MLGREETSIRKVTNSKEDICIVSVLVIKSSRENFYGCGKACGR